ncbi:helix-turn-helix transcriptional regulator [Candidatus Ruminimicrobiellum ovillum]|uniref:helix-turn-helix transcriptional regulator n=1 Tax=Candidatus Ruminimicrobiellum ovillum TaxID=1947927 RepID=UPI0035598D08
MIINNLSKRETDIFKSILKGFSYKEIALELNISTSTVDKHLRSIYCKLHVKSTKQLFAQYCKQLETENSELKKRLAKEQT